MPSSKTTTTKKQPKAKAKPTTLLQETLAVYHTGMSRGQKRATLFATIFLVWMVVGTLFYAYAPLNPLGLGKGYWMAVNIGYSIGTGYPSEPISEYHFFSAVYVLIGASFISLALSFFIDKIGEDSDNWFTNLVQKQAYEEAFQHGTLWEKIQTFLVQYSAPLRAVGVWLLWIIIMASYSGGLIEDWNGIQAVYFAVSTCSTGGLFGLPADQPDWLFGITGFFAMLGVPLMGIAMVNLSTFFMDSGDLEASKEAIREDVDIQELYTLQECGFEDNDGCLDRAEFIILCMVRMGSDPELIKFIIQEFNKLDKDGGGTLSIREITRGKFRYKNGQMAKVSSRRPQSSARIPSDSKLLTNNNKQEEESPLLQITAETEQPPVKPIISFEDEIASAASDLEKRMYEAAIDGNFILAGELQKQLQEKGSSDTEPESQDEAITANSSTPENHHDYTILATTADTEIPQLVVEEFEDDQGSEIENNDSVDDFSPQLLLQPTESDETNNNNNNNDVGRGEYSSSQYV